MVHKIHTSLKVLWYQGSFYVQVLHYKREIRECLGDGYTCMPVPSANLVI